MWWRRIVVASILVLWLFVGITYGADAALMFVYPLFVACVVSVWAVLAGNLSQRAAAGYYERQLDPRKSGRWRDPVTHGQN